MVPRSRCACSSAAGAVLVSGVTWSYLSLACRVTVRATRRSGGPQSTISQLEAEELESVSLAQGEPLADAIRRARSVLDLAGVTRITPRLSQSYLPQGEARFCQPALTR